MVTLATIIPALDSRDWFAALDLQDAYFHITIHPAHRWFLRHAKGHNKPVSPARSTDKGKEIHPGTNPEIGVYRSRPRLHTSQGTIAKSQIHNIRLVNFHGDHQPTNFCEDMPPDSGTYVRYDFRSKVRQTPYALSAALIEHGLCTQQTLSQQTGDTTTKGYPLPTMMDTPRECMFWNSLPTRPPPSVTITTDASLIGWGAHLGHHNVQGKWSPTETRLHINLLELRAVHNACRHFLPLIRGTSISVLTDNMACMFYINRQGGARSHLLCVEAMNLWNFCIHNNINITASYLPGCQNITADSLSRHFSQEHEWKIHDRVLETIFQKWGHPVIDLFASATNHKCPLFCSRAGLAPESLGDAFLIQWNASLMYAFPKIPLIPRVIRKIRLDRAYIILIAPTWPRQTWFPYPYLSGGLCPTTAAFLDEPPVPEQGPDAPSRPSKTPSKSVAPLWFQYGELNCSEKVKQVLLNSRRLATRNTYHHKWKKFSLWCQQEQLDASKAPLSMILDYLLELKETGLAISSIKMYLAAITTLHEQATLRASGNLFTPTYVNEGRILSGNHIFQTCQRNRSIDG
ncbi:uncharacterized protein RBU57_007209 [Macrochelys suwanniensis]